MTKYYLKKKCIPFFTSYKPCSKRCSCKGTGFTRGADVTELLTTLESHHTGLLEFKDVRDLIEIENGND